MNGLRNYGRLTKSVNRLFLFTVIWILGASFFLSPLMVKMSTEQRIILSQFLYVFPVLVFIIIKKIPLSKWILFRKIKISTIFMVILFTFLLIPLVTCLNILSMFFVTNHVAATEMGLQDNPLWMNLLLMAVLPAVVEEFTFRGIFYPAYREKGVWMAAIGCGVTFGFMHMNFNQFFYALALGIAFCLLMEATGSIFAPMAAHFVVNGWSVSLLALQKQLSKVAESLGEPVNTQASLSQEQLLITFSAAAVIAVITTCIAGCVLVWIAKHCGRLEHLKACLKRKPAPEGTRVLKRTFITPTYAVTAVICIVYMVIIEIFSNIG